MSAASPPTAERWWERAAPGSRLLLAFVKLDRVGSTGEWGELPEEEVRRRREQYVGGIEYVAREFQAAQPLHFQGDGVMLFLADDVEPAPIRAFRAARLLLERIALDLNLAVRIGVHAGEVPWDPDTGKVASPQVDLCGHLEHVGPENAVTVSEDVFLSLPEPERRGFAPLGITIRDGTPAYAYPAAAASRRRPEAFRPSGDLALRAAFQAYALSPDVCRLRYVGFRLARREPPSLDVRDVFVSLQVRVRSHPPAFPEAPPPEPEGGPSVGTRTAPDLALPPWKDAETAAAAPPAQPFLDVFARHRSLIVLGEPGAGKTTLLRWLAVTAAGGRLAVRRELGISESLLPVPVSVGRLAEVRRTLGNSASVVDALARYFHEWSVGDEQALHGFLQAQLEAGGCLVLLDGLDEVTASERHAVQSWLEAFGARYSMNRFVASSRIVGYGGFTLPGALEVVAQPFDDAQVARYVEAFHRAYRRRETGVDSPESGAGSRDLLTAIAASPRLQALARNPFLLSALALIHRAEGRLPRHRVQVYEMFARALCETWETARRLAAGPTNTVLPYEDEALPILGHLARRMHEEWPTGAAPEEFVLDTLSARLAELKGLGESEAAKAARRFLQLAAEEVQVLLERGTGRWGFLHLTFQEFFAAAGLHADEEFEDFALKHLFDPRWEEVLRLGVGYLAIVQKRPRAAERFIKHVLTHELTGDRAWVTELLKKEIPLAALLAAEAGDVLPLELQDVVALNLVLWILETGLPADHVLNELAATDFADRVAVPLIESLGSESRVRYQAARALGQLRRESAVQPLVLALTDEDGAVREAATVALGRFKSESALQPLLAALGDEYRDVRKAAAEALGEFPSEVVLQPLLDALEDERWWVREGAAKALGQLGSEAALEPLLDVLRDEDGHVRDAAAAAVSELETDAALPPLLDTLKDKRWDVREAAAKALHRLHNEAALQPLLNALQDEHPRVRAAAARALGWPRSDAALQPLLEALRDENAGVRQAAASALTWFRSEAALRPLVEALKDQDAGVRRAAVHALPWGPGEVPLQPLVQALRDEEESVRWAAAIALPSRAGEAVLQPLLDALADDSGIGRFFAARTLGRLDADVALQPLLDALKDGHVDVRQAAADALGELRSEKAAPALVEASRDGATHYWARRALWRISEALSWSREENEPETEVS